MKKNYNKLLLILTCLFFINVQAQELKNLVKQQLHVLQQVGKVQSQDVNFKITSEHISHTSKIQHIYYSQMINEIIIANTESSLHISSEGEIIRSNNRFIKNINTKISSGASPSISAIDALKLVAKKMNYSILKPLKILEKNNTSNQKTKFSNGGFANQEITAALFYFLTNENKLVLSWKIDVLENNLEHYWNFYIDAISGKRLDQIDNVFSCSNGIENNKNIRLNYNANLNDLSKSLVNNTNELLECENCYEVFEFPIESPYYGERSIVINPADPIASPFGWHDYNGEVGGEFLITKGNNITAQTEQNYSPNGGVMFNFTEYPFNENFTEENDYADASITNAFYWGNVIHDILYKYGFDENAGNFQQNNYNHVGLGGDQVRIIAQSTLNCNASILLGVDGHSPSLLLGTCGNKDAGVDNLVIAHEYAHGLTRRLIGGAMSPNCLTGTEPIGEGYSDWYGLMFTLKNTDVGETPRGIANYFLNQGENGEGVRPYPYTTNMSINPLIYEGFPPSTTYEWVWGSILWELTWALIDEYGIDEDLTNFTGDINQDAGNIIAFAIVTESLKLLNCNPSMVDARNAILEAYILMYGNDACNRVLWNAFAKRGLGIGASFGGISSFEVPSMTASFTTDDIIICENAGLFTNLGGGNPFGGIYSGIGVTDNGDGMTFAFNTEIGVGTYVVTYEVGDSSCSVASVAESAIVVEEDNEAPNLSCLDDAVINLPANNDTFTIIDYQTLLHPTDNCELASFTQNPPAGTIVGVGDVTVNIEASDVSGNITVCSFVLSIVKVVIPEDEEDIEDMFNIFPNPTNNKLMLISNNEIKSLEVQFFDINGKLIQSKYFQYFGFEDSIFVENLASGMYFVSFKSNSFSVVKRILKI